MTTAATLPTLNLNAPQPAVERAALLALLDTTATVFQCSVMAMMMATCSTPQIRVMLQLLQAYFNSTQVALHFGGLIYCQIFRPT